MTIPAIVYYDKNNDAAKLTYENMIKNNEISDVKDLRYAKMLIAIGGDGTLIRALQWKYLPDKFNVGLIGTGTVNYLAMGDNPIQSIVYNLHYNVPQYNHVDGYAINEISIRSEDNCSMLKFDIFIDDELICENVRGDGVIIATSVGSTAYAMSAGGPIIDIGTPVVAIVPNNEYSRKSRPIVISNDRTIKIVPHNAYEIWIDGSDCVSGYLNEEIIITKGKSINLWHANTLAREEKNR